MIRRASRSLKKNDSNVGLQNKKKPRKSNCSFCNKKHKFQNRQQMISKQLFLKYSASQNFFYSKDIQDVLTEIHTPSTVLIKDFKIFDAPQQCLKGFIRKREYVKQLDELTQYYKYYKDLPRIHMNNIDKILRKHHDSKRLIQYNKLRVLLNVGNNLPDQKNDNKKHRYCFETQNILKGLEFESHIISKRKHENESLSTLQIKQKLESIIKKDKYQKNFNLSKLDNQYTFDKISSKKDISKTQYFQDVSQITNKFKSPEKVCMKKKPPKDIFSAMNSDIKKKRQKNIKKRLSMQNMRTIYLKSQRSGQNDNQKKHKRKSQDNLIKQLQKNDQKQKKQIQNRLKQQIRKQLKQFLISTNTSYQKIKYKFIITPTNKTKNLQQQLQKSKHYRVASQQFQIKHSNLENLKKQKFKITIHQNNVFNIVLDNKSNQLLNNNKNTKNYNNHIKKTTKKII